MISSLYFLFHNKLSRNSRDRKRYWYTFCLFKTNNQGSRAHLFKHGISVGCLVGYGTNNLMTNVFSFWQIVLHIHWIHMYGRVSITRIVPLEIFWTLGAIFVTISQRWKQLYVDNSDAATISILKISLLKSIPKHKCTYDEITIVQ